ncbi:MAG: YceI family protein [Caulobacteraceae bacterium]
MKREATGWLWTAGAGLVALAIASAALAACPPGLPPGVFCGSKDPAGAPAGTYRLDPNHAAVIARVSHLGYSYSLFRFDKVEGAVVWDPAAPARSSLSASVETASVATNVAGFAKDIAGPNFLKSAAYPKATFVSTAFRRTDATHGQVDGQFTLMGKTRPLTFQVELIGAGKGFGAPRLGVEARGRIEPAAFGLPAVMNAPIEIVIDAEFEKKG